MIGAIFIVEKGITPGVSKREFTKLMKPVWEEQGVHWHRKFRPKHFTHAGAREYGYQRRKGQDLSRSSKGFRRSYTGRKLRRFGHTLPLVWTGESRELTRIRDVRATSKGVRVVMRANRLNFRPKGGRIRPRVELTTVSDRERDEIVHRMDRSIDRKLKQAENQVRRRRVA